MPRLELRLLGFFEARVAGNLVEFATRQSELLLAILALEPGRPHSREQLSALLWGDRSDEQARVSLRQAIYRLRQALRGADPFPLEIDTRTVRLNPTSVWSDLAELEAADGTDPEQLERAVALCRGDLLDGLKGADPEMETWLLGERARVRRLTGAKFSALAELLWKERRLVEIEVLSRRRVALDPYDEDALREAMSASALQGRRNAALEAYREFAARLRADLSVNPAEETEALFRRIRSGEVGADAVVKLEPPGPAQPPTAPIPDRARVAMSERRYVTALHALLPGLARLVGEMDPEASMGLAGPVRDRLFQIAERHGGVIHRRGEDSLTAVFGAGAGTESSPIEAGRTALEILAEEPSAWIGLHTGEAVVGETIEVGAVALAARKVAEGAAAGSVLMSRTASRLCEGYFEVEPGPTLPGAGRETVRLTGLSPARNSWQARASRVLSPFSGRRDELAELHRCFSRLDRGVTVAMITAEAGLGKSRLVDEFLASPEIAGARVLRTGVALFDVETTHSALGTLLRDWAGIRTDDRQDRISARVRDRLNDLGSEAASIAPPLRLLLDLPVEDPLWSTLSPGQQQRRIVDALRTILECECRDGPVILVFEDAHWSDGETLQILQRLISSLGAAPVLVIVTCRPEFRPPWAGNSAVRQIRLEPLETKAAERLLDGLMGNTTDLGAIRAAVLDRSGGVPLFLEEMVRDLRETGQLNAGVGHLTIETPATVRGVIAARIERLPAPARRVLQIASVIGVECPAALLETLVAPESVDLGEALLTLAEAELFYRTRGGLDASYAFKHAMTQDVAYRSLLIAHREPLHARLLDLCEAYWAARRAEHVERLADHARLGAVWDRAAVYLSEAGERAVQRTDFGRARVHFERALDALRRLPPEPSVWRRMAELHLGMRAVLNMAGDYEDILGHLDAAAALADKVDDDPLRAQVQIHLNYFLNSIGDFERCAGPAELAEQLAARTGDPQLISEAALARGQMLRLMADYPGAIAVMEGSLDMWLGERRHHRGGHLGTRSIWALGHLAISYANVGRIEDARRSAAQAVEIAGETRRPTDMQFAIHHQAIVDRFDGRLAEALSGYQEAIGIVVSADLHYFHPWIAANQGEALLAAGRIGDALKVLAGALAATEGTALDRLSPRAAVGLGKAQLISGDIEGAEATLRRAIARSREFRQDYLESIALRQLAGLLKQSAPAEAASLLHRADRLSSWAPLADPVVAASRARAIRDELGLPI